MSVHKDVIEYYYDFLNLGGIRENVLNLAAHWLYGTSPETLAKLSKRGIVYNPPGFKQ